MSTVVNCPTCGAKAKVKEKNGETTFTAITEDEMGKKIAQLKKAMIKFKLKAASLEKELERLRK